MPESNSRGFIRKITGEHILLVGLLAASAYMFIEAAEFREPSGMFPRFIAMVTIIGALMLLFEQYIPGPLQAFVSESGDMFSSYEEEVEDVSEKAETEIEVDGDETFDGDDTVDYEESLNGEASAAATERAPTGSEAGTGPEVEDPLIETGADASAEPATDSQPSVYDSLSSPRDALDNKRFVLSAMTGGYVVLCYLVGFLIASPVFVLAYSLWVRHEWYFTIGLTVGAFAIVYSFMELLNVQLNSGLLVG
jgi:hypothetical protein